MPKKSKKKSEDAKRGPDMLRVGVLNVVVHPHTGPETYAEIFSKCVAKRTVISFRGKEHAAIAHAVLKDGYLDGVLTTFLDIKRKNEVWGNPTTGEQASLEEVSGIRLPEHQKPGFARHHFTLDTQSHRLAIDVSKLTPNTWHRIVTRLLVAVAKADVTVEVTVEPTKDILTKILGMKELHKIVLVIKKPNGDDLEEETARVIDRMDLQHIGTQKIELTAQKGATIEPDEATVELAHIAASNGSVTASGKTAGKADSKSTLKYPWIQRVERGMNPYTALKTAIAQYRNKG